jgi:sulfoxide reductase catalytic subunit YedY
MLIKITDPFPVYSSEITPEALYAGRRRFLKQLGLVAGASIGGLGSVAAVADAGAQLPSLNVARKSEMAGGESLTPYEAITHYNNYYEFGTEKDDPARNAGSLRTRPWSVVVDGECEAPGRIDLDDLIKPQVLEDGRSLGGLSAGRCAQAIPANVQGEIRSLLYAARPTSDARYGPRCS